MDAGRNGLRVISYLIPKWDKWRSEFVQEADDLVRRLTGFTGSAGILILHDNVKHLFVDSRYTLQAERECPKIQLHPYKEWKTFLKQAQQVVVDPWLWSEKELEDLPPLRYENLIDKFWPDRLQRLSYTVHDYSHYTDSTESKIQKICTYLNEKQADWMHSSDLLSCKTEDLPREERLMGLLVTDADSLSWLLNKRCFDKPYSLAVEQMGVVYADGTVREFPQSGDRLIIDTRAPLIFRQQFPDARVEPNPIHLMKACKSPIEIEGFKNAHKQDAQAMRTFLTWLEQESQAITERDAEEYVSYCRQKQPDFIAPSFRTISAAGEHAAIVHYHTTPETNTHLKPGDIYLIDSGGHYFGGTTDVTRTVIYQSSSVPKEVKENFTLVLKGFLALITAVFPKRTTGSQLDCLARQFLWKKQRDYGHGTGHGVGSCLSVHEGPHSISSRLNSVPLEPGMIVSIEPGFYKPHAYGIRIENLAYVEALDDDW